VPIQRLLQQASFGPAEIAELTKAYDAAIELLRLKDRTDPLCELVAAKTILVYRSGERDPSKICVRTIKELGIPMPESRQAPRLRTLKGGSILFGLAPSIDCVIRNMSDMGAQLAVESPVGIPEEFTLLIKPEMIKRTCRVIWRKADRIGVRFAN
jgi:PilZ domain